jgi:site-specific DNA-methyltransferase (adenine-specific)
LIKGQKAGQGFNDVKGFGVNTKLGNEQAKEYISNDIIGRFPANVIHDGSDEVVEGFPNTHKAGNKKDMNKNLDYNASSYKLSNAKNPAIIGDEGGSASRFFYCAKASKSDRNEGLDGFDKKPSKKFDGGNFDSASTNANERMDLNFHPTVKPTELMRYLCRLITPPNGIVLDPFMGSGSTGKGAILEGFDFIGMELDPEYVEIAKARIEYAKKEYSENQAQQKLF